MNFIKELNERVIMPAGDRFGGLSVRTAADGLKTGPEARQDELNQALSALLYECFEYVEAYRPYRSARNTARRDPLAALAVVPPVDAAAYKKNPEAYFHQTLPPGALARTDGRPEYKYAYPVSKKAWSARRAAMLWVYGQWGLELLMPGVELRGRLMSDGIRNAKYRLKRLLADNRTELAGEALTPERVESYVERLSDERLAVCEGDASVLTALSGLIERAGKTVRPSFKAVISSGETLLEPERKAIARVLGAPVRNAYITHDDGPLAWECEHGGMHIIERNVYIEALDGSGGLLPDGVKGALAVTGLFNYAAPRLRFLTGDVAAITEQPCECGRQGKLLVGLEGRKRKLYTAPDGRFVPERVLEQAAEQYPAVSEFTLDQRGLNDARLSVTLKTRADSEQAQFFRQKLTQLLPGVLIDMEIR